MNSPHVIPNVFSLISCDIVAAWASDEEIVGTRQLNNGRFLAATLGACVCEFVLGVPLHDGIAVHVLRTVGPQPGLDWHLDNESGKGRSVIVVCEGYVPSVLQTRPISGGEASSHDVRKGDALVIDNATHEHRRLAHDLPGDRVLFHVKEIG